MWFVRKSAVGAEKTGLMIIFTFEYSSALLSDQRDVSATRNESICVTFDARETRFVYFLEGFISYLVNATNLFTNCQGLHFTLSQDELEKITIDRFLESSSICFLRESSDRTL